MKKAIIAILILGAVGTLVALNLKGGKKGKKVEVHTIARDRIVASVTCTGKIEAKRTVDISANVMGEIINLDIAEGDVVEPKQFLLQIDPTQLEAQTSGNRAALDALRADAEAARANQRQAELDYNRARRNFADQIIPEADSERALSALEGARAKVAAIERRIEQARAALRGSRDSLAKTTIRSPIAGMVTDLPVEAGEIAVIGTMNNPGTKLMTISDMSVIEAHMEVDETDVPRVALGQPASLRIDAFPGQSFAGVVSEIGSSPIEKLGGADQAVEFEVKIVLSEPPGSIRPGFSVSAQIETGRRDDALAVPVQALVVKDMAKKQDGAEAGGDLSKATRGGQSSNREDDVEGVFLVADGKAAFRPIETGLQGELVVEANSGLAAGDVVITGPFRVLRQLEEGDLVEVDPPKDDAPASP